MGRIAPAFALVTLLVGAGSASADLNLTASFTGANPANTLKVNGPTGTPTGNVLVGQYNWLWKSGDRPAFLPQGVNAFSTFCLEVTQFITYDTPAGNPTAASYTVHQRLAETPRPGNGQGSGSGSGMGQARADRLQTLFDLHYGSVDTATEASAFQLAIWEVIFETSSTLSVTKDNGTFSLKTNNSSITTQANSYLDSLIGVNSLNRPAQQWELFALTSQNSQDQVVALRMPEPGSVLLALSGIGPMIAVVRVRRRLGLAG